MPVPAVCHHLVPDDLARAYREVYALLRAGGWFFNLDHVGAADDWEQRYRRIRDEAYNDEQ